jgi:hypothetical protein
MSLDDRGARPTPEQLAWGLAEIFDELSVESINEMLGKNIPLGMLDFIAAYAEEFSDEQELDDRTRRRIPDLLLLGYLLRVVEERVLGDETEFDA